MSIEAMRNAVEAMDKHDFEMADHILCQAIAEAEKQEQGEPYGYLKLNTGRFVNEVEGLNPMKDKRYLPLYTTPQQRTWVGLTDEETNVLWVESESNINFENFSVVAYEIEAKLRSKNA
jgi:hypothetical protein